MKKLLPEVIMHYNVQDERYYIYCGEDYVADTQDKDQAIYYFSKQCEISKLML